jgi:GT2 family glycosyltransferase
LLIDAVSSVVEHTKGLDYEIIVVDNNSPDNSIGRIENRFEDHEIIKFIKLGKNIGFGRANNAGYEVSSGRNIFCLNPDTVLINNAVKILSDYLDSHDKVGLCGGNLYHKDGNLCTSYNMTFPSIFAEFSSLFGYLPEIIMYGGKRKYNNSDKELKVGMITGADLMVKRSVIEEVGFFRPEFFMYFEDTDFCFRVARAHYLRINLPSARIYHLEGKSTKGFKKKAEMNFNGRKTFYSLNYSKTYTLCANFLFVASSFLKYVMYSILRSENRVYWGELLKLSFK